MKIKSVYFFNNGNITVFNFRGEQVGELQGWSNISEEEFIKRAKDLSYDLSLAKINPRLG